MSQGLQSGAYGAITPIVDFSRGMEYLKRELLGGLKQFGIRRKDIDRAIGQCQDCAGGIFLFSGPERQGIIGAVCIRNPAGSSDNRTCL